MARSLFIPARWLIVFPALLAALGFAAQGRAQCVNAGAAEQYFPRPVITVTGAVRESVRIPADQTGGSIKASEALERAGGLRDEAYALGAMLLRPLPKLATAPRGSVAHLDLAAGALEALQVAMSGAGTEAERSALIESLRKRRQYARLPVVVDEAMRRRFPRRDLKLLPGDVLYIPARPATVTVIGAVSSPGMREFRSGDVVDDYLERSGGLLGGARKGNAAVYLPDGELRPLSLAYWNYKPQNVPPGSIVIVPYRNESLQRYARDAHANLALAMRAAEEAGGPSSARDAASLLPPPPAATTACPLR